MKLITFASLAFAAVALGTTVTDTSSGTCNALKNTCIINKDVTAACTSGKCTNTGNGCSIITVSEPVSPEEEKVLSVTVSCS
ncbi:uncharacterized protein SETTUDRAFT_21044 [Exserohilum turcica Et28A]|uniref:Uncharacterized protein n=1 Tax=Exserohilum turcicum (strain 28A) TaxID=671987 RepID=R0IF51_EXST2|nr:uncharacterized protein SETTUDRAFT_21044 [Exserohilum turcica Et28A]EOA83691.1 hypothetical protein SETTUDRAFT_21044 [Exserohilum turcica Et28A]